MTFCSPPAARRVTVAVAAGLLSALGATTASAVPVSTTLNYVCTFPLIKPEPLQLVINADIPATVPLNTGTGAFNISASAAVNAGAARALRAVGTASIEGTATAAATVLKPGGVVLPLGVPTVVPKTIIPAEGAFSTPATGKTPSLVFQQAGEAVIKVGDLVLNLTPRLADGLETGLATFETECKLVPGQNTVLAAIKVGDVPVDPPPTVNYAYALTGNATLKNLTKGSVPLKGSIDASLAVKTGDFTAALSLDQATAKLTSLGFLPVTAKLAFQSTAPTTGTLQSGVLSSVSKVRIKLPQVSVFGLPLAGGASCQARQISSIALKSTDAFFNPLQGGTLVGGFSISDLTGCGFLTGIVSPLTAGGGNAIALKLTPKPTV